MTILEADESIFTAEKLYGGNDFTGNCFRSEVILNSGRFDTIYGAGCGNYVASPYLSSTGTYTQTRNLYVPNNEEVVIHVNGEKLGDTTVWVMGELYGGGQMGTAMRYVKNSLGQYLDASNNEITSAAQAKVADTNLTVATAHEDAQKYAYVIVNVHGGSFAKDIFAGAQGKAGLGQLIYGLKMLNMDKGTVKQSIYGGSQSVSDGYSRGECNVNGSGEAIVGTTTTMRPSSILNVVGGLIYNHVYGAGYMGFTHGSVYVNIGLDAVTKSPVWRTAYGSGSTVASKDRQTGAYADFEPGKTAGLSDTLTLEEDLLLRASVYAGANWGQNTGSYVFDGDGFFGGESRILIDGNGYSDDGTMIEIANSVLGAGTSVLGGDVRSRIDIRNYGDVESCYANKSLKAVQRANSLYLQNTAINYIGTPDASSALYSQDFAIHAVDTVSAVGYNFIGIHAPKANIEVLRFFEDVDDMTCYDYTDACLTEATLADMESGTQVCDDDATDCDKIGRIDPVDHKYTALVMYNGVTIDITDESGFGEISGYAYLIAEDGTDPTVRARIKNSTTNPSDGGFSQPCNEDNASDGMSYTPYNDIYRYWAPGKYRSTRTVVLLAHSSPSTLDEDKAIKVTGTDGSTVSNLSLAHTTLTLPPSRAGYYYKLGVSGVHISDENDNMSLIDVSWNPTNWNTPHDDSWQTLEDNTTGDWYWPSPTANSSTANFQTETYIANDVNTTFGLVIASGEGFTGTNATTISTSTHTTTIADYQTSPVAVNDVSPVLDLYLTYDSTFFNSILGSVKFVLVEYDASGVPTGDSIEVEAYVSTILNDFKDMEFDLIATANEGESNTFTRRGILPATLKKQDLYVRSVKWYPTEPSLDRSVPYEGTATNTFQLSGDRTDGGYILTDDYGNNKYRFGVTLQPVENSDASATSDIGWYTITNYGADVYSMVYDDEIGRRTNQSTTSAQNDLPHAVSVGNPLLASEVGFSDLTASGSGRGVSLGVLDGRGVAGLNFELFYDGRVTPDWHGYFIGDVVLGMASYPSGDLSAAPSTFNITLHIKVRPGTDTIYIASGNTANGLPYQDYIDLQDGVTGKLPSTYVKTFAEAMALWKDNSVICILDEVVIDGQKVIVESNGEDPVKIIRYEGHHHDAPLEERVYRGPMIKVQNGGELILRNVVMQGSSVAMRQYTLTEDAPASDTARLDARASKDHLVADTNVAFGPMLSVTGAGSRIEFAKDVVLEENWNGYTGSDSKLRGGAISITDKGRLILKNNVTIRNNFTSNTREATGHCDNGAVYIDRGFMEHPEHSANKTSVTITDNYLISVNGTNNTVGDRYWKSNWHDDGKTELMDWVINTDVVENLPKANVFLTRKPEGTKGDGFESDGLPLLAAAGYTTSSRIGISKWFPGDPALGEEPRDTIYFAYQDGTGASFPQSVVEAGIFSSDEDYNIRYSHGVNEELIYLTRCATFRHQMEGEYNDLYEITEGAALEYILDSNATCPNGNDKLVYRASGGLFPYTYTWKKGTKTVATSTSSYTDIEVWDKLYPMSGPRNEEPLYENLVDTFYLPYVKLPIDNTPAVYDYTVIATDEFGCQVSKDINITLKRDRTAGNAFTKTTTYGTPAQSTTIEHWTDTNSLVTAAGLRTYRGVTITPYAWPSRYAPNEVISAVAVGDMVHANSDSGPVNLNMTSFCEGDTINLQAFDPEPRYPTAFCGSQETFVMWDFDPYADQIYTPTANYIVPPTDATVMAYYGPKEYWTEAISDPEDAGAINDDNYYFSRNGAGYVTTYNDDVHIYNEAGLAWLISTANGLNRQQARQFYFNKVFLHKKSDGSAYDMSCYLWTPIGTAQYPFRGWFIGVGSGDQDTARLANNDYVVIKNIIVNEPQMSNVGFFGHLDTARISGIKFEGALMRGAHHVGTLAARSTHARINNVAVVDSLDRDVTTTLLVTHNISGGLIGYSESDIIKNTSIKAKYLGDAVYSGGVIGYGNKSTIANSAARNDNRMNGLYLGGIAGYLNGEAPVSGLFRAKRAGNPSVLRNNYVRFTTHSSATQVGGLVGHAENTIMENNYVYGQVTSLFSDGGVASSLGNNANVSHNYYAKSASDKPVGTATGNASLTDYASFQGSGNAVTMDQRVDSVNNLTRVLNMWVREQNAAGGDYLTWTSDMVGDNHGFPLFGTPDLIPVFDSVVVEDCGEVEWNGVFYTEDTRLVANFIDSVQMIDSTLATIIRVHHASVTQYADSATVGLEYSGYGFYVSAAESELLRRTLDSAGHATLVLTDTLQGAFGCDSVITLSLTFSDTKGITDVKPVAEIKVYPNPTTSVVNVATDEISHVELYDNGGRTLRRFEAHGQSVISLDLSAYSTGVYYIRVHTPNGVTIQKVIKR